MNDIDTPTFLAAGTPVVVTRGGRQEPAIVTAAARGGYIVSIRGREVKVEASEVSLAATFPHHVYRKTGTTNPMTTTSPAGAAPVAGRLWMWFGQPADQPATLLMVHALDRPSGATLLQPLIAGSLSQANDLAPIAEEAARSLGIDATLREYELVALTDLSPATGAPS